MSSRDNGGLPAEPTTLSDVRAQINWAERIVESTSPTDERLDALVRNSNIALAILADQGTRGGELDFDPGGDTGPLTDPDFDRLPEDSIGTAAEDINPGDTGPAVFQIQGTRFYSIVTNTDNEEVQAGAPLRVIGGNNGVTTEGAAALGGVGGGGSGERSFRYQGKLYEIPRVTRGSEDVKVANQLYIQGEREDVGSTLEPGESKEIARIEPSTSQFGLLKYTNATAHEHVEYEYYIDDPQEPDPDLSGTVPWATPPDLFEVSPGGFKLIEDYAILQMVNKSDTETYDNVMGTLTGLVIDATE